MSTIREVRVYETPPGGADHREALFVQITDAEGRSGCSQPTVAAGAGRFLGRCILDVLAPVILGEDARRPEAIWQKMMAALYDQPRLAVGPIDVAVWDLAGKTAGVPVREMLGGHRTSIAACASLPAFAAAADCAPAAQAAAAAGYRAIKLRGAGEPRHDIEACAAARDAVGPGVDLMLDVGGGGYRRDGRAAVAVGRELEQLGFRWYEHPLGEDDLEGRRELRRKLDIPIAGPGGSAELADHAELVRHRATDIVRPDAGSQGGITMAMKVGHLAEAFHVGCEPRSQGHPLMRAASLAGALATPAATYHEVPVPSAPQGLPAPAILPDAAGMVHAPEGAGLGIEVDLDELEDRGTRL